MWSLITGSPQTEKASQEQVSDKAAAGVTALARLIQIVRKDSGSKVHANVTVCQNQDDTSKIGLYRLHGAGVV